MHTSTRNQILLWWDCTHRDFPWRETRDPWSILVSEFMLQQTQAKRVIPKYETFLQHFPTATACSQTSAAKVIELWSGLGYNRRALYLHATAQQIATTHDGELPSTLQELLLLTGVGEYSARAILCFAFEKDVGVVDVNVKRVLSRFVGAYLLPGEAQRIANANVPNNEGWRWNQAMIELGATICTSRNPKCSQCPAKQECSWVNNAALPDPSRKPKTPLMKSKPFEGSDRQGRGKFVEKLRERDIPNHEIAEVLGWPNDQVRCERVIGRLIQDGLVVKNEAGDFSLPK